MNRVPLVAPALPVPPSFLTGAPEVAAFAPPPVTRAQLDRAAHSTRPATGAADSYCPEGATTLYGDPPGVPTNVLPGAGYISPDEGLPGLGLGAGEVRQGGGSRPEGDRTDSRRGMTQRLTGTARDHSSSACSANRSNMPPSPAR